MNPIRIEKLSREISSQGLDCLALVPGANLFYITGLSMRLSDRPTVAFFRPGRPPALFLPDLEAGNAAGMPDVQLFLWSDEKAYHDAFQRACAALGLAGSQIGVEAFAMRVVEARLLERSAPGSRIIPADGVISALRMHKDAEELNRMRKAAKLAQAALTAVLGQFRPGMTEREVASLLKLSILAAGSDDVSFNPIVSAGPNSANPHAHPTDRPVAEHRAEFLLFDWGVYVEGYASDITRTFPIGEMEPEMRRIYQLVRDANAAAQAAVRPGATCDEVDRAARRVIVAGGYGDRFLHRTGHGLGLEVHEPPFIVAGNETVLVPGMTFTIEPGIYLPGRGGVRIEDDVVVTKEGCESLTTFTRDWTPIG